MMKVNMYGCNEIIPSKYASWWKWSDVVYLYGTHLITVKIGAPLLYIDSVDITFTLIFGKNNLAVFEVDFYSVASAVD